MKASRFGRRRFLEATGLCAAYLPLLNDDVRAAGPPRRMAAFIWPNGVREEDFFPTGDDTSFVLSNVTKSLQPHRTDITILDGLDNRAMLDEFPKYGGHASLPYLLTGGNAKYYNAGGDGAIGNAISVDQYIADALRKTDPTPMHSLVLAVDAREESKADQKYISFRGPAVGDQPNAPAPQDDVHAVYRSLFSAPAMPDEKLTRSLHERRSILDLVGKQLERFATSLGGDSKLKVQQHLKSIRDIEMGLDAIGMPSSTYNPPADDATIDPYKKDDYDRITRVCLDLIVGAFATGSTRVSTLLASNGHNNSWVFKWLGAEFAEKGDGSFNPLRSHHEIAHRGNGDVNDSRRKNLVDAYFVELFASLIDKFKAIPEGNGTLLDNSVLLFANNMGNGASHSNVRLPWILAGKGGGYLRTGRVIRLGGKPHNGVLVAMASAMGVPTETFGPAKYGGELPGLRA
jgi:Protein of unknown function (DUF1552)